MNRYLVALGGVSLFAAGSMLVDPPVNLQASSPGTQQVGNANISGKLVAGSVSATSTSAGGQAVVGTAAAGSGLGYGGLFKCASPSGTGVRGYATAATGFGFGGDFQTDGPSGTAVRGIASSATGPSYGVYGKTNSKTGRGVFGFAASATGFNLGGEFISESINGVGVMGRASADSGTTYGGWFRGYASNGYGLVAENYAALGTAYGAVVRSWGSNARAFVATTMKSSGVIYGVTGQTLSPDGYGVFSNGRTGASGTKSFRIDHPLDPENRYLNHYCAEGPEPLNVYSGTVRTDSTGIAWVQLPAYFAEINRDFRYQLTVVDGSDEAGFAQAKIAGKIRENRFKIRTSVPNVEVCWEVKGVRNDRFVRQYGAPVEVDKAEHEAGRYQHPELYGQPKERGLFYDAGTEPQNAEPR